MIEVEALSFTYPGQSSLIESLNLVIQEGALFGLLGPNGAGKSTLIRLMTGLLVPMAGKITLNGMDYARRRREIQRMSAVVPQEYAFYPKLSAEENLSFFCRCYGVSGGSAAESINNALHLTRLERHRSELAGNFSGGMKRRLNLAIGLLNRPRLLFLDEPTVGIDPQSRNFILQAILEINQAGTTIIYSSHYMEEVERLCDRIGIMDHGKILALGTLKELLQRPAALHLQLERDLTAQPLPQRIQTMIEKHGLVTSARQVDGKMPSQADAAELVALFEAERVALTGFHYGRQTLESLFFDLTTTSLRD